MNVAKLSHTGNCPTCAGTDWKLAKMMFLAGHSTVNTTSSGGGFGASAGIGRGQGGVGVNYQAINLNTTGSHATGITLEYAPPQPPAHYEEKATLLQECSALLTETEEAIKKIKQFAHSADSIKPGIFSASSESRIHGCEARYSKLREKLLLIQSYEKSKSLWDLTRICGRCGESFVTPEAQSRSKDSFDIPVFHFSGMNQKCPHCNSYQWKTSQAFFKVKIDRLQSEVLKNKKDVETALEDDRATIANEGGFLTRLGRKLFSEKPETAILKLAESKKRLSAALAARDEVMKQPAARELHVCSACEAIYTARA